MSGDQGPVQTKSAEARDEDVSEGPEQIAPDLPAADRIDLRALPRRERLRAMMREEILEAARTIMQDEGIKGLTMRALGRAVGVTAPTLYDYFPSKEAVLDALFIKGTQLLMAEIEAAAAPTQPGLERLRANALAFRRFAIDHPDLYLLIFGRVDADYRPREREIECVHNVGSRAQLDVMEAMATGDLRPGDPHTISYAMWALAHGHIMLELSGFCEKFGKDAGEWMYLRTLETLFTGLTPHAQSADLSPRAAPDVPEV